MISAEQNSHTGEKLRLFVLKIAKDLIIYTNFYTDRMDVVERPWRSDGCALQTEVK
jgi:hypothetical protein